MALICWNNHIYRTRSFPVLWKVTTVTGAWCYSHLREWPYELFTVTERQRYENIPCEEITIHIDITPRFYITADLCAGNSPDAPQKGLWLKALIFSLICAWTNGWVNKRGNFRRYRAHYDVTVMNQLEIASLLICSIIVKSNYDIIYIYMLYIFTTINQTHKAKYWRSLTRH